MERKKYKLEELILKFDNKRKPLSTLVRNKMEKKFPYYGANGIIDYVDDYIFDGDYLLIAEDGTVLLENLYPVIYKVQGKFWVSNHAHIFKANENIVLQEFLYYSLKKKVIKDKITGSTQPKLSQENMNNIELYIPNLEIQAKITGILKKIDKNIELNNDINNNLYKFAINYLNEKTEANAVLVSKFAKIQGGYAFKSKDLINSYTNNRIFKIKNLRNEINADVIHSQFVTDEVIKKINDKFRLNKGDVAIAMTGAEIGKTGFIYGSDNYYLNQRVGVIRGYNEKSELYLKILFLSEEFQTLLNSKGYGSAQPNISTSDIENVFVKDISESNLNDFYQRIKPIYEKIISNSEEIINLEQLRDTLLPRLMNGEIDLDNIEI